jgi:catechol 2,3-dioxygenase
MIPAPNYRLPAETRIGAVRLQVADLERSVAYYQTVLGMRVIRRDGDQVSLGAEGSEATLVELHERPGARSVPRRGLLGLYHFAILLPDRAALGRFLHHLEHLDVQAGMSDHFVSEAIYLQDPDNLGIEVYADRPRSQWRIEDGQLSMSTVPLDVNGVIAAGEGVTWAGMPSGTTMGHVHLHVGDIERAAAFYHEALGFDKTVWNYPGALFLSAGGYHHHLGVNTWARGAASPSDDDAKLLEWEIVLPKQADVDAAAASLGDAGHEIVRQNGDAVTRDPWLTRLRLTTDG